MVSVLQLVTDHFLCTGAVLSTHVTHLILVRGQNYDHLHGKLE